MKTRMLSAALLVAAMMSASMSASAETRKRDFRKDGKADFRKEIRFAPCNCAHCREFRKILRLRMFDQRDLMLQRMEFDRRQDPRFHGQNPITTHQSPITITRFDSHDSRHIRKAHKAHR